MDGVSLRIFLETAMQLSFAAVAKDRGVAPSAISRSVAALEAELETRLFHRTTRKMVLTEAGVRFVARAEAILVAMDEARDDLAEEQSLPSGIVRLSASTAFGECMIVPHLARLRERYPEIRLDLLLSDDTVDLARDKIDLAVRLGDRLDGDFVARKLCSTRYRVCASPSYVHSAPPIGHPQDFAGHRALLFTLPEFRSAWRFRDAAGHIEEVPVRGDLAVSSALSLRSLVRAGLGPALMANWLIADDLAEGRLVDLFPEHRVTATSFDTAAWLIYPSRSYLPRRVRVVIDFLRAILSRDGN